jgi:hypothetical protein
MYTAGDLPESFFGRGVWLIRATSYMELVEPIEIANYYRCQNWKRWTKGKRHYIEGKRPKRFPFFEAQYAQHYPTEKLAPVLHQAQCEADAVDAQELAAAEACVLFDDLRDMVLHGLSNVRQSLEDLEGSSILQTLLLCHLFSSKISLSFTCI